MSELIKALQPRAELIAGILADRIKPAGKWEGFRTDEKLVGILERTNEIKWVREITGASMTFGFIAVRSIDGKPRGKEEVLRSDVIERHEDVFDLAKPLKITQELTHTFTRTQTREEAKKQAWEVGAKASFSAGFGSVKGSVEASAKFGQDLETKISSAETVSDTIRKTIEVQGPVKIHWVAERSTDTVQQVWDLIPDLDFKLYWRTDTEAWEWASFQDVFIPAANGDSPVNTDFSIFASSSPSHNLFEKFPVDPSLIACLRDPVSPSIQFRGEFQTVNRQSIQAL